MQRYITKNINIMQDFQYAINIAYDINTYDKIKNYIPTPIKTHSGYG